MKKIDIKSVKSKNKKLLLIGILFTVLICAAVAVVCVIQYIGNGPFSNIIDASLNTIDAESFAFSIKANNDYAEGRVAIDFDKKDLQVVINFENNDSVIIYNQYLIISEDVNTSDGDSVSYVKYDISDDIESCFDSWKNVEGSAGRGEIDWDSIFVLTDVIFGIDKKFAEKHINFEKADAAVTEAFFLLNDADWLTETADFKEICENNITTYNFDFDLKKIADSAGDIFGDCMNSRDSEKFILDLKSELYGYDEIGAYARSSISVENDYLKEIYLKVGKGSFFREYGLSVSQIGSVRIDVNELQSYLDKCSP